MDNATLMACWSNLVLQMFDQEFTILMGEFFAECRGEQRGGVAFTNEATGEHLFILRVVDDCRLQILETDDRWVDIAHIVGLA